MTELEEAKKAVEQICLRQNDCWYDTKTIATAVYVILTHMIDADPKTEPTISKMEQVDEPQIGEMMTEEEFDSMLARVLIGKDEPQTERSRR